jgi:hypothetical protein
MDPILVTSLIEFLSAEEIRAAWKKVLQAHLSVSTNTVIITASQQDGEAASGIEVRPEQRENFMMACREALTRLGDPGNPAASSGGGQPHVRFDLAPVRI